MFSSTSTPRGRRLNRTKSRRGGVPWKRGILALGATLMWNASTLAIDLVWDDEGGSADKTWTNLGNWNPDNLPDSTDNLFIGVNSAGVNQGAAANDITLLTGNITVNSVTLGNGADIVNSNNGGVSFFQLQVDQGVTVGSTSGTSVITLYRAPAGLESMDANTVTVNDNGQITLVSDLDANVNAELQVDNGLLDINTGGTVFGMGVIELTDDVGAPTTLMDNDGTLIAGYSGGGLILFTPASTLHIMATDPDARLDLDGAVGGGTVSVNRAATLDIDVQLGRDAVPDTFNGTMNLSDASTLDMQHAWSFAGTMNVNTPGLLFGSAGTAARIAGGAMTMTGGTITLDTATVDSLRFATTLNATAGTIANSGHILFDADATIGAGTDFQMNGSDSRLTVGTGATVTINDANFNLDGAGTAANITTVESGGLLDVNLGAGADEEMDHVINLNSGQLSVDTLSGTWTVDRDLNLNNSTGVNPVVSGDALQVGSDVGSLDGNVNVTGAGVSQISAPVTFNSDADVNIAAGSTLRTGAATFNSVNGANNARFQGAGTWQLTGTNTFSEATTIDMVGGTVDLDSSGVPFSLFANDTFVNAPLTINAATLADYGKAGLAIPPAAPPVSDLTVDNSAATGTLTVNLDNPASSWTINSVGVLNLVNGAGAQTLLFGSPVNVLGTINVTGDVQSEARLDVTGRVNVNTAGQPFRLAGGDLTNPNTLNGGNVSGVGPLGANANRALVGHGTINTSVDFDGNSRLIARGGTLNVNGTLTDVGRIGTDGGAGVLNMGLPWNTNVTEEVLLNDGRIEGAFVVNAGVNGIAGFGRVTARVSNETRVDALGGTLEFSNPTSDWDGAGNAGQLVASHGALLISDNADFPFNGTVRADAASEVATQGFALEFEPASTLELNKGAYRSTNNTRIGGAVNVSAGQSELRIPGSALLEATSVVGLTGDLFLENGETIIESGATFAGGGKLVNPPARVLTVQDGANVGVLMQNRGTLHLGNSPGQTTGSSFEQTNSGVWKVELAGTGLDDYDRMTLVGTANLGGQLAVSLLGGFNPVLNDVFTILSAPGGVLGAFSLEDFAAAPLAAGLAWDVVYNPTNVQLAVIAQPAFTADFDNDGDVDGNDYTAWEAAFGVNGDADADGNGDSSGSDFLAWQQQFGSGAPPALAAAAGVPEPTAACLIALAGIGFTARRRKSN